jgi:2-polyprenyl-3-methyl-5-hydroxy-6-metoxy-1,4-benzoquinol methylase
MDRNYWEKIAPKYNDEIFDVLHNDRSGVIVEAIEKYASKKKTVIDIGCAVGKWVPLLATKFKHVVAADISAMNLKLAKEKCKEYKNVEYVRMDMSASDLTITPCDMALCINAILTDSIKKRINFYQSLSMCLNPGGVLILVVPSLESALYSAFMYDQMTLKNGNSLSNERPKDAVRKFNNLRRGIVDMDNVPSKHHLKEELQVLLRNEGFSVKEVRKVEYNWKTEFDNPP